MIEEHDQWDLPSARAFLEDVAALLEQGGGIIVANGAVPEDLPSALEDTLRETREGIVIRKVEPRASASIVSVIAESFGRGATDLEGLVSDAGLMDHVAVVDATCIKDLSKDWIVFLRRFRYVRRDASSALSVYILCGTSPEGLDGIPVVAWAHRLRRLDVTIWADLHARLVRTDPLPALAEALAVELGGWRLDLAAAIASAPHEQILDPISILEGWKNPGGVKSDYLDGENTFCSGVLYKNGDTAEIYQRIWRAQLKSLYPWIEEIRQQVISKHRRRLISY